jgi:anaerobic magnesium-protoporphyrin IX monomethyl ester cyclase
VSLKKRGALKILFIVPMHLAFEDFVNPPSNARHFKKDDGKFYNSLPSDLPLGVLSMSAYLKKFVDVEIKLIDFNVELNWVNGFEYKNFYDYCYDFLKNQDYQPDIVGVSSLFSPSFYNFMDLGRASKELFPASLIIGGGNIPTNSYSRIYKDLKCNFFDALAYGEGEKPLLELVQAENKKEYLSKSSSWITKANVLSEDDIFTPSHDFIEDLDDIPFYDYDLCDFERHGLNPVMSSYATVKNQNGFHIMTSRGCPFKCTFCASHKVHGRKMRYHSLERVKTDFIKLKNTYGASTIIFQDDHLMGSKSRVYEILSYIEELELEAVFQNGLALYALCRKMLNAFHQAGVRQLVLPVESGSEKVLKKDMLKPLKFEISQRVAKDCRELGIYTNANILIGMPGETKQDIEEGKQNLLNLYVNWYHVVCASPLVGSDMHSLALDKNYIDGETLGADYRRAVINTKDFSAMYIQEQQYLMNLELNFVQNSDIRLQNYEVALKGMNNVIRVKEDHFFGHYYAAICYRELKDINKARESFEKAIHYSKLKFWKKYIVHFNISIEGLSTDDFLTLHLCADSSPSRELSSQTVM